jgi:hypothetical protein
MFLSGLVSFVRIILYGWVIALWELLKLLCEWRPKLPHGEPHPPTPTTCVEVDHPAFVRPDPLLYSQRYLLAHGLAVTYDNPDITLALAGVPVSSHELEPGKTYDVTARIWNNSLEAPVVAMPVHLSFLDFGVGNEPIPIGSGTVNVGVKGSASQPGFVTIPWTTPPTPGHYCLQVLLDPVDDLDVTNNLGQENTDVVKASSPAEFSFTLRNDTKRTRRYRFEVDAYVILALVPCSAVARTPDFRNRHRRENHPVPPGFVIKINPETPVLGPDDAVVVKVLITPPGAFVGRQPVNVNVFHEGGFAGGVTLTVTKGV